jgi:hypothetical protein
MVGTFGFRGSSDKDTKKQSRGTSVKQTSKSETKRNGKDHKFYMNVETKIERKPKPSQPTITKDTLVGEFYILTDEEIDAHVQKAYNEAKEEGASSQTLAWIERNLKASLKKHGLFGASSGQSCITTH